MFELLTGELPFRGNARMLVHQVINEDAPSPRLFQSGIPRDLETICLKCLEKELSQRYTTAKDLADDLRRFLLGEAIRARPVTRLEQGRRAERNQLVEPAREIVASLPGQQDAYFAAMLTWQAADRLGVSQTAEAERLARVSVYMLRQTLPETHPDIAFGLLVLGQALAAGGEHAEAETCLKESLSIFRRHYPNDEYWGSYTAFRVMVGVLRAQQKDAEVSSLLNEMASRLRKQKPNGQDACVVEQWLLWAARMEACQEWKQALEGLNEATRLVDNTNYFTSKRIGLGFAAVGCQLDKEGTASTSEIARVFEQSIIYCQRAIDETPNGVDTSLTKNGLAAAHVGLSLATEEMGQYDRAIVARKRALRIWEELAKADPRHEAYRQEQASCSTALAELLCALDQLQEALKYSEAGKLLHAELQAE